MVNTVGFGWLSIFSADADSTDASTINWYGPNQTMVNTCYTLIRQSDAGIKVSCGGGGQTQYVLDLTAVLVPFSLDAPASAALAQGASPASGRSGHTATRL